MPPCRHQALTRVSETLDFLGTLPAARWSRLVKRVVRDNTAFGTPRTCLNHYSKSHYMRLLVPISRLTWMPPTISFMLPLRDPKRYSCTIGMKMVLWSYWISLSTAEDRLFTATSCLETLWINGKKRLIVVLFYSLSMLSTTPSRCHSKVRLVNSMTKSINHILELSQLKILLPMPLDKMLNLNCKNSRKIPITFLQSLNAPCSPSRSVPTLPSSKLNRKSLRKRRLWHKRLSRKFQSKRISKKSPIWTKTLLA